MTNLAAWLLAAAAPLAKRVLIALGIGFVTYAGYSTAVDQVKTAILAQWATLGGPTLALMSLGGVGQAMGIVLSAMAARAALMATSKLGKITA